mmetsp:Transcript_26165/g.74135  ORF Transcript_26165/g.74135 Transcript_26165/m.74135 type:complete len:255 (+) Transcript_26165:69-833(+)
MTRVARARTSKPQRATAQPNAPAPRSRRLTMPKQSPQRRRKRSRRASESRSPPSRCSRQCCLRPRKRPKTCTLSAACASCRRTTTLKGSSLRCWRSARRGRNAPLPSPLSRRAARCPPPERRNYSAMSASTRVLRTSPSSRWARLNLSSGPPHSPNKRKSSLGYRPALWRTASCVWFALTKITSRCSWLPRELPPCWHRHGHASSLCLFLVLVFASPTPFVASRQMAALRRAARSSSAQRAPWISRLRSATRPA